MRSILGKLFLAPVVLAAVAFTATTAKADATVKVPFSFTVAGKSCPAGLYTVKHDITRSMVTLTSKNSPQAFTWVLGPGDAAPTTTAVILKFNEEGETHTLRSVQYGSLITSRLDKKTKHSEHVHTQVVQGQ